MKRRSRRYTVKELIDLFPSEMGAGSIGEVFGVSRSCISRWRNNPTMTISEYTADRYAITLGIHPAELWSTWISDAVAA